MLLSGEARRSVRYMSALVLGVPCVSTTWVRESVARGRRLPIEEFLLPAGRSLLAEPAVQDMYVHICLYLIY